MIINVENSKESKKAKKSFYQGHKWKVQYENVNCIPLYKQQTIEN